MSVPRIYYNNRFSAAAELSGSETSSDNPVRRIGDGDRTLKYYLFGSPGTPVSGTVHATMSTATLPTHFVQARATTVSGYTVKVFSSDVGGGNEAQHLETVLSGDTPFVEALSGVSTARRVWWVEYGTEDSGLGACNLYELMLADQLEMPRGPEVGVARTLQQNFQQLQIPGAASFKLRLGDDYRVVAYSYNLVSGTELDSVETCLQVNDGGEPFWLIDDHGTGSWAELQASSHNFDDQAGVSMFSLAINEIPLEQ